VTCQQWGKERNSDQNYKHNVKSNQKENEEKKFLTMKFLSLGYKPPYK